MLESNTTGQPCPESARTHQIDSVHAQPRGILRLEKQGRFDAGQRSFDQKSSAVKKEAVVNHSSVGNEYAYANAYAYENDHLQDRSVDNRYKNIRPKKIQSRPLVGETNIDKMIKHKI